jgi:PAS domain S-box-containing protein
MASRLRIMHLEDDAVDAELVAEVLKTAGLTAEITRVHTRAAWVDALRQCAEAGGLDLLLADYALPGFNGLEALRLAQEICPLLPFIFVTGQLGEESAIQSLQQGATDYVLKTRLSRLGPSVRRALAEAAERTARRQAEAAANAEREWLRVTLASIGDAVVATDTARRVTFMNAVAEGLTGWAAAEAVGQPIETVFNIVDSESRAPLENPVARVLREGAVAGLANHTRLLRREGIETPIDDSGAPIRDAQGRLLGAVLVFRDISARQAAEAALRLSDERFRRLVTATAAIIWTADSSGQFAVPQPSWESYTGQPWEAHRGMGWLEALHPDDRAAVAAEWRKAVASLEPFQAHGRVWRAKTNEDCHFEARAAVLRHPDGSPREWIGTILDVNERELARSQARESEARFRILADSAPVLMWMTNAAGACEFVNRPWLEFTGRSMEQELGQGWLHSLHPADADPALAAFQAAFAERQAFQAEFRLRRHDGVYRWMVEAGVPRFGTDGAFAGYIASCLDIQSRREVEDALARRARQQAAVAELGQRALAGVPLPQLMDEVAQVVNRTLGVEYTKVLQLLPGGQALRLVAGVGWRPGLVGSATVSAGKESQSGFTLLSGQPVVVVDLRTETRFKGPPLLVEHGVLSGLSAIVRGPGEPWGVLGAHTAEQRAFGPDDVNFLQSVANVLAEAIARAGAEAALRVSRDQISAILRGVAEGVTVQAPDGRLVYANDTAARIVGYPDAASLVAAPVAEIVSRFAVFDEAGQPLSMLKLPGRQALQGQAASALLRFSVLGSGDERWSDVHAQPILDENGKAQLAVNIFHDVTELKRAEMAQRLLAEAGELLARGVETGAMLGGLARLSVPQLGEFCIAFLLVADAGGRDEMRAVARAHVDPEKELALLALERVYTPTPDTPRSVVGQSLRQQEPVLEPWPPLGLPELDPALVELMPPELRGPIETLGPRSILSVPLVARGRTLGALVFARGAGGRAYSPSEVALAQELARRTALALDNTRLYEEAQALNANLERRVSEQTDELKAALEQLRAANAELELEVTERQGMEDRFRNLLQAAPDAIIISDENGRIVLANDQSEAIFGYTPDELIGQPIERLIPPRLAERHALHRRQFMRDAGPRIMGQGLDLFGRHKDGREFPVEVSLSPLKTPEGMLITSAVRDLTERLRGQQQLRQSERQLTEAQQLTAMGSWQWDIATDFVTWSLPLYRIYGLDPSEFKPSYSAFLERVHPDDAERVREVVGAAVREGRSYDYEHRVVRTDGGVRVVHARGEVLRDASGKIVALTGTTQDITERKRIEEEVRASREQLRQLSGHLQATREEERARISREIHDELGGALTGLKMGLTRLDKGLETLEPAELHERTKDMIQLLDQTVATVRRIASDLRPGILDDFGLAAAIEWQLQDFGKRSGLAYAYDVAGEEFELDIDANRTTALFRVFQETLTNVARHAQAKSVSVRLELNPEVVRLEVRDDGLGISTANLANVRSLGLLGMRERVHLLNGELEIHGAPGQGTTVTVRMPLNVRPDEALPKA